jgi:site-specific DNA recombinase
MMVTLAEGEISELHVGLKGTMNALFVKDLAKKVRRGLEGRVRDGKSGGGLGYGYQTIRKLDERGELIRGDRRIDQAQADVVRRIFLEYAAGRSPRAIVRDLNAEGIKGPRSAFWTASTVHGNWQRGTGILNSRINPEKDWVIMEVPELRVLDDDLWAAAKGRQRTHSDLVRQVTPGNHLNAAHRRRYLLSGLISCGICGSSYSMIGNDRYGCSGHRNRGNCVNRLAIRRDELEERVLRGLKEKLLAPELVAEFIRAFHEEVNSKNREAESIYDASRRELAQTSRKIESVMAAIEAGIYTTTTRDRLVELEQRKAELEAVRSVPPAPRIHPKLSEIYREKVSRLADALNEPNTRGEAGQALRTLIDVIRLTPTAENTRLSAELYGELAGIIALSKGVQPSRTGPDRPARLSLVAGEGFEPPTLGL